MGEYDLATLGGLAVVIPMVVGGIKKLWPTWVADKEPTVALILTYAVGITAKLTISGAFSKLNWLTFIVSLFFVAIASMSIHDTVINKIVTQKTK